MAFEWPWQKNDDTGRTHIQEFAQSRYVRNTPGGMVYTAATEPKAAKMAAGYVVEKYPGVANVLAGRVGPAGAFVPHGFKPPGLPDFKFPELKLPDVGSALLIGGILVGLTLIGASYARGRGIRPVRG